MLTQLYQYYKLYLEYYEKIKKSLGKIINSKQARNGEIEISIEAKLLYEEAVNYLESGDIRFDGSGVKSYDLCMLKITVRETDHLKEGSKITDRFGGKGVIVAVQPDEFAPVDEYGQRCDIVASPSGTIGRGNSGREDERVINRMSFLIQRRLAAMTDLEEQGDLLRRYLVDLNPDYGREFGLFWEKSTPSERAEIMMEVITDKIYVQMPTIDPIPEPELKALLWKWGYESGKLSLRRPDEKHGYIEVPETMGMVDIGKTYIFVLKQTAELGASATSTENVSSLGVPSNKSNELRSISSTSVRVGGMEFNNFLARVGADPVHLLMSLHSGNPLLVDKQVELLLTGDPLEPIDIPIEYWEIKDDIPAHKVAALLFQINIELVETDPIVLANTKFNMGDLREIFKPLDNSANVDPLQFISTY